MSIPYSDDQYGFTYGAAQVSRCMSDKKKGWVLLQVTTPKQGIDIYVTRTGKIRVYNVSGSEWRKPE